MKGNLLINVIEKYRDKADFRKNLTLTHGIVVNDFLHFLPLGSCLIFRLASLTINARTSQDHMLPHVFLEQGQELLQKS